MTPKQELELKLHISQTLEVWKNYCEQHSELYELTCNEYMALLESDIERVENIIEIKNDKIAIIAQIDEHRLELVKNIGALFNQEITRSSQIINLLNENNLKQESSLVERYNQLLLEIIDRIQEQNKKNQFYLNKAIVSLQKLKESFGPNNNFKTYGSNGSMSSVLNK